MKRAKHIVWDWNGTLLDDVEACVAAINVILQKRGMKHVTIPEYVEIFDFPVRNYYLALGFDLDSEDWDALAKEYHVAYEKMSRTSPLRHGMVEALKHMRNHDLPMSILSASEISILERMLGERNIRSFFGRIYGLSNLHAASKLDLGRVMMSEIGASPEDILMIGDTIHDAEVAAELGIRCVLISGGHQAEHRLRKRGCTVVPAVKDVFVMLDVEC